MSDECTCPIRPDMTYRDLIEEIYIPELFCTADQGYICPELAKALETARIDKRAKDYRKKQLVSQGHSPAKAEKLVSKKKKFPKGKHYQKRSLEELA